MSTVLNATNIVFLMKSSPDLFFSALLINTVWCKIILYESIDNDHLYRGLLSVRRIGWVGDDDGGNMANCGWDLVSGGFGDGVGYILPEKIETFINIDILLYVVRLLHM